ncbi:hypothetical protein LB505_005735 [Fusarium chuoi]|nr:hypothetical protein LB505_005735 [Fusarium chuoi]
MTKKNPAYHVRGYQAVPTPFPDDDDEEANEDNEDEDEDEPEDEKDDEDEEDEEEEEAPSSPENTWSYTWSKGVHSRQRDPEASSASGKARPRL